MSFLKNFFRRLKYSWNKNNEGFWTPFDMSLLDKLKVGDFLMAELTEDVVDMVSWNMTEKGAKRLWQVKRRDHGALVVCGSERTLLQYWGWKEGNLCEPDVSPFISTPFKMKVFYHKEESNGS